MAPSTAFPPPTSLNCLQNVCATPCPHLTPWFHSLHPMLLPSHLCTKRWLTKFDLLLPHSLKTSTIFVASPLTPSSLSRCSQYTCPTSHPVNDSCRNALINSASTPTASYSQRKRDYFTTSSRQMS